MIDHDTLLAVWDDRRRDFRPVAAGRLICECDATLDALNRDGSPRMWEVEVCPGEPFIECQCGEQYSLWANMDRYELSEPRYAPNSLTPGGWPTDEYGYERFGD